MATPFVGAIPAGKHRDQATANFALEAASGGLVLFERTMRLKTPCPVQVVRRTALDDGKTVIHHKCGAAAQPLTS
jgi:hypothetical protein